VAEAVVKAQRLVEMVAMACIAAGVAVALAPVTTAEMAEAETLALMLAALVVLAPLVAQVAVLVS
jgi:hypothetical protein